MKNFGVVIILFMLSGCFSKTGNYASSLQNWVGQPEYVLYQSWGQPENTFYLSGAEKEVTYINASQKAIDGDKEPYSGYEVYYPAISTPDFGFPDTTENYYYCKTSFTIQNGIITDYSFNGDDCVSP